MTIVKRYLLQTTESTCAPIAIYNTCMWAGKSVSKNKDFKKIFLKSNCDPNLGTLSRDITRTLRHELKSYATVKRLWHPALWQIEEHLKSKGSILFSHIIEYEHEYEGHIALFTKTINGEKFLGHNINGKKNIWISRTEILSMLYQQKFKHKGYPGIWLIKKV